MKMSKEEADEQYGSPTKLADTPEYPYGLEISLNDEAIAQLGLDPLPAVGKEMMIRARVKVSRTSAHETMGGEAEKCLSLQITDMAVEDEEQGSKLYA